MGSTVLNLQNSFPYQPIVQLPGERFCAFSKGMLPFHLLYEFDWCIWNLSRITYLLHLSMYLTVKCHPAAMRPISHSCCICVCSWLFDVEIHSYTCCAVPEPSGVDTCMSLNMGYFGVQSTIPYTHESAVFQFTSLVMSLGSISKLRASRFFGCAVCSCSWSFHLDKNSQHFQH